MDDYSPDNVGSIRQTHHEYFQNEDPSQGQSHPKRSIDISKWGKSDSFHGHDQRSQKKVTVKDRDKLKRMQKGNPDSMLPPLAQRSVDFVPKNHMKKKSKGKHGRTNQNEGEEIYGKTKQAHISMPKATNLCNASVKKHKSETAMASKTASVIDKDALADFIRKAKITQRECRLYTPKDTGDDCQCGRDKKWHDTKQPQKYDSGIWDMKTHTLETPCKSFGEIKFEGFGNETANRPYIRVDPKTNLECLWTVMTKHWKLHSPRLLISITGGAKRFNPTPEHQEIFKRVLMNAATTTDAWIITGGMATGVMKIVGEAVKDHILTKGTSDKKIVALGIATWGCVANRECLDGSYRGLWPATYRSADLESGYGPEVPLDHNHTHFILVDDGSIKKYGVEIELGAKLEKFITKQINTGVAELQSVDLPMVKIVVEGGVNTMKTVSESVAADIPVLVLQGSGRAADFISYGYKLSEEKDIKEKGFHEKLKKKAENIFEWEEQDKKEQIEDCVKQLEDVLVKKGLITVFNLNEADRKDIDTAILDALLKAKKSNSEAQLSLALAWNRSDIAREKIITNDKRKQWKKKEDFLYHAMFIALVQNKVDFVKLFVDCGVSFNKFLSIKTLWNLYACSLLNRSDSSAHLLRQLIMYIKQSWRAYLCCRQPDNFRPKTDLLKSVGKIIVHLLRDESMNVYSNKKFMVEDENSELKWLPGNHKKKNKAEEDTGDFEQPEKELFLWAILFNREDMARMLWKKSINHIAGALVACALLKRLASKADDNEELELKAKLLEHSEKYEDLATAVLGQCYRKDKQSAHQLVVRQLNNYGRTTLFTLAEANELMKFMGHTCCQTKLNLIWKGQMAANTPSLQILISIIFPILIPLIKFSSDQAQDEVEEQPKDKGNRKNMVSPKDEDQKAKASSRSKIHQDKHDKQWLYNIEKFTDETSHSVNLCCAFYYFYTAPITVFIINTISYLVFLAIFTYFVLTDLYPGKPSVLEYITWGWSVTLLIEEFRQVAARDQRSIKFKIHSWFSSIWNKFDLVMYLLFLVSVITRGALSEDQFTWARIIYSITLALCYLRFMQVFFVEKHIGPKVIIIKNMIVDLVFFMMIFTIFLLSFGVAYQANLYPNSEPNWYLLKSVVYMPFWQLYGELFLDNMEGKTQDDCIKNETLWRAQGGQGRCPADNALVPLLGAIYLVLTNILLINLLIAMFSYTFQKVQVQSENVWRFYRFSLVHEYYDRPFLCPPFIIFIHLYRLFRYVCHKLGCVSSKSCNEFRLELDNEEDCCLTLIEKAELEEYLSSTQRQELESVEKKVTTTHERLKEVIDDLDHIRKSIKLLSRQNEKVTAATLLRPVDVQTDVKNDTRGKMQMHQNEPESQVEEMLQILKQILRNQKRNIHTSHLEITDISLSTDA
ncbi:hypothetical protein CHS0354_002376 [Potamilus streckersoni]|uniref:Transient receptor potential cation channel subfamily M member 2 n=1 Tax=Potamilus streckersoni TaxID=2493646 RepID=A0AAE0VYA0_9BIVA|nr:hypothetical protein CHS0354_002376 [Potamilus streckersoni]